MLDLTKPLECEDGFFDGINSEHVFEHLLYSQDLDLMTELKRILRPGGTLRVSVPSLDRYLDWDDLRSSVPKMDRYSSLAEAVSNLTQNHGHTSVWQASLLIEMLESIGFEEVKEWSFNSGSDPELAIDEEVHQWESSYVEARKPLS